MSLMKNDGGFGIVGFLILLPFLLSVLALIAGSALLFKADAHLQHECRTSVLNSERTIAQQLRKLMALNPQASALRLERTLAETQLKAALAAAQPAAIAAAEAYVSIIKARQTLMAIEQKKLIAHARLETLQAPRLSRTAVKNALVNEARENRVTVPDTSSHLRPGFFDIIATPKNDLTPNYNPSTSFSAKQTVDVDVKIEVCSLLPEWLRKLLPTRGLTVNTHCQATIENQENQWTETLSAAR